MIELNTNENGKPRDYIVKVIKTYDIHTCDGNPKEAIVEAYHDDHIDGDFKPDNTELIIEEANKVKDYKKMYLALKRNINKYLKANRNMVDFMHEHLMDLADEQFAEYEALCEAEGEAANNL